MQAVNRNFRCSDLFIGQKKFSTKTDEDKNEPLLSTKNRVDELAEKLALKNKLKASAAKILQTINERQSYFHLITIPYRY